MTNIKINNKVIDKTLTSELQSELKIAYGKREHPLCLCTRKGAPMYIAKLQNDIFILKRMPNTGLSHNLECSSFEMPTELSGRGDIEGSGVSVDESTGISTLKFDFSLSKRKTSIPPPEANPGAKTEVKANPKKLTLRAFFHYLYEEAGFCKWTPRMEGKRNWYVIEKYLRRASLNKIAKGEPLDTYLMIPSPYAEETAEMNKHVRRVFIKNLLSNNKSSTRLGMVIGEFKEMVTTKHGYKIAVKHMAELPIFCDEKLHKQIEKVFAKEFSIAAEVEHVRLMVIATYSISASENLMLDTATFVTLNKQWIPFDGIDELRLIDCCIEQGRNFYKPLRYNVESSRPIASLILNDTEKPTAIFLVENAEDADLTMAVSEVENPEVNLVHMSCADDFSSEIKKMCIKAVG